MELSNWAPEHSDALRELVCKGISYAEAARVINQRFNTDYSRSAALGRARRLGLGPEDRPQPTMPAGPTDPVAIGAPRAAGPRSAGLPWPVPPFKATKKIRLRRADIEPRHVSLTDLESEDCRYPYGGDEEGEAITFCGHRKRLDSSYCALHHRLSCDPIPPAGEDELTRLLGQQSSDLPAE